MKMNNPFYLDQQGRGMPVFRGSAWQMAIPILPNPFLSLLSQFTLWLFKGLGA